jgi:DNA-binding response OmpR family regulator
MDRVVRVVAMDDVLPRALAEHRTAKAGWRIAPLDPLSGMVEPDALVIFDLDDGAAVGRGLELIRRLGFDGRVLILRGEAPPDAFKVGPEDGILPRPVRLGALLARLDAWAAGDGAPASTMLGPYDFRPADRMLRPKDGAEAVRLTELESRLLACLAEAGGALVGREQLLARVWRYSEDADTHTVETHVWRLRQKIETDDPSSRFLVTEPGGYRLVLADGAGND